MKVAESDDVNALMTELNLAVAREDYAKAALCKKRLDSLMADEPLVRGDWAASGAPAWLNARLGDLQMRFPTPVQSRSLGLSEEDLVIRAPTGSGKTLAFLTPILGGLTEDLEARERKTSMAVQNASVLTPMAAMEALSPALRTSARVMTTRLPSLAPPRGPPLALVIAPSSALCMQHANA
ncbi:MAG: DEAD/DEAH box helicase, partial [Planctomycetota bacterium]